MRIKLLHTTSLLLILTASFSFAHTGKFHIAFKSGYFGDQSDERYRVTSVENPLSFGSQLRYYILPDFALQIANESLQGSQRKSAGEELNVQTSLTTLFYPYQLGRFSPFVNYGVSWVQYNAPSETNSRDDLNFQAGVGGDLFLLGNLVYSLEAKFFTDGVNYRGWGTSFSLGYRF